MFQIFLFQNGGVEGVIMLNGFDLLAISSENAL